MAASDGNGRLFPLLVGSAVLLGVMALVVLARREASASARFQVDPGHVRVVRRPAWLPPEMADMLAAHLSRELSAPASLVDKAELRAWEDELPALAHWIHDVGAIEPRYPGRARVEVRLRRPVLRLPQQAGDVLVAADGGHLGQGWVDTEVPPLVFERLGGRGAADEVAACARAAAQLEPHRAELAEAGLFVDRVGVSPRGPLVFLTTSGVELEWGRAAADSEFAAVDLPVRARVQNLLDVLERHPGLFAVQRVVLWKDRPDILLLP